MTAISNVSLTNTFDEWRTITNQLVFLANEVEANGNLVRVSSNTSAITVTANIGRGDIIYVNANVSYNIADVSKANLASANVVNAVHNVLTVAFAQANAANVLAFNSAAAGNAWTNTIYGFSNTFTHTIGGAAFDKANAANVLAFNSAAAGNAWTNTVFGLSNVYTRAVGTAGNLYTQTVGTAGNDYTTLSVSSANAWTNTVFGLSNVYTRAVGTAGNNYTILAVASANAWVNTVYGLSNSYTQTVGTAGNNYSILAVASANAWTNTVFGLSNVYARAVGTAGNDYTILAAASSNAWTNTVFGLSNVYTRAVGTAGNNYAETVGTAGNVYARVVGTAGNTYAETTGASSNAWTNTVFGLSNVYARAVGTAGNLYTQTVGTAGNLYTQTVGTAGNIYGVAIGASSNAWTNTVFGLSNSYTQTVGAASNLIIGAAFFQANQAFFKANIAAGDGVTYTAAAFGQANQAFNTANTAAANSLGAFDRSNIAFFHANSAFYQANQAFINANTAQTRAENAHTRIDTLILTSNSNTAIVTEIAGSAYAKANDANVLAFNTGAGANAWTNTVYGFSNSYTQTVGAAGNTFTHTIGGAGAFNQANQSWAATNTLYNTANTGLFGAAAYLRSNLAFYQANLAFYQANLAYNKANSTTYTSNVVISVADNTNSALKITQTGTAAAILVQDSTDPDNTPFVVDANGYVGIGTANPTAGLDIVGSSVETFIGTGSISGNVLAISSVTSGAIQLGDFITTDSLGMKFGAYIKSFSTGTGGIGNYFLSETATVSSSTFRATDLKDKSIKITKSDSVIQVGEPLGIIQFNSTDASIESKDVLRSFIAAQSTSTDGSVELVVGTASGVNSASERLRITKDGALSFNGSTIGAVGTILRSQGDSLPLIYDADSGLIRSNLAFMQANIAFYQANQAFFQANNSGGAANGWANTIGARSNAYADVAAGGANGYTITVGTAGNNYSITVASAANGWANTIGARSNAYADVAAGGANAYARTVGTAGNNYSITIGASSNAWTNTVYGFSNSFTHTIGGAAFYQANQAFAQANNALPKAGGTITGDLIIQGNVTISGNTTYANTQTLLIGDNILVLNADIPSTVAPSEDAGLIIDRGNAANAEIIWNETNDKWTINSGTGTYLNIVANTDLDSAAAGANGYARTVGTAGNTYADTAASGANGYARVVGTAGNTYSIAVGAASNLLVGAAFFQANQAFDKANSANILAFNSAAGANAWANTIGSRSNAYALLVAGAAFDKANAANVLAFTSGNEAEGAFLRANIAFSQANQAFAVANTSGDEAEGAFLRANIAFAKANAANVLAFNALANTDGAVFNGALTVGGELSTQQNYAISTTSANVYLTQGATTRTAADNALIAYGRGAKSLVIWNGNGPHGTIALGSQYGGATGSSILGFKSRGGNSTTPTAAVAGDNILEITGIINDGASATSWKDAATILLESQGYVATNYAPGRISFKTTSNVASATPSTKMLIEANGNVLIGKTSSTIGKLDVNGPVNATDYLVNGTSIVNPTSTTTTYSTPGSGNWTIPSTGSMVRVRLWGGGGSGGRGGGTGTRAGGGGGGGFFEVVMPLSDLGSAGSTVAYAVGAGGTAVSVAGSGNAGSSTTFGSFTAYGGRAGTGNTSAAGGNGGAGGGYNSTGGGGGDGTDGVNHDSPNFWGGGAGGGTDVTRTGGDAGFGGGGGGGALTGSGAGAGGTSAYGGAGGAGGTTVSGTATSGTAPGGGGGGQATNSGTSGAGAAGRIEILVW